MSLQDMWSLWGRFLLFPEDMGVGKVERKVSQVAQRKRTGNLFYLIIKFLPEFINSFYFPM